MARAGSMGTGWHCSRRACFRTPQGFQLEAVCEMGAPRGRTSRGPITPAAPSPGEALGPAPPPQPRSAGCAQWPLCPVFIVEDTRTHTRGHPPPRPTPWGTPTAQQVWGAEALSPPRREARGGRGCSGPAVLAGPAQRGSGWPWRAAASHWRGLGAAGPPGCPPGAPPAGRGPHAGGASAGAAPPAPRTRQGGPPSQHPGPPAPGPDGPRGTRTWSKAGAVTTECRTLRAWGTPPCVPPDN